MHEFLWMLLYGNVTQQETSNAIGDSQTNRDLEQGLDDNDDWMEHLKPVASICNEDGQPLRGWFRFCDVLLVMPLTVLCKTIDIGEKVKR